MRPVPHDRRWAAMFQDEQSRIAEALSVPQHAIHHIGSTAIPDILAKPIIDILLEVSDLAWLDQFAGALERLGYEAMGEFGIAGRRYFRKTSPDGVRTHHLHAFLSGSPDVARHIAFRDYLKTYPDQARRYSELKQSLLASWSGVDAYIEGKASLVRAIEQNAVVWQETISGDLAFISSDESPI